MKEFLPQWAEAVCLSQCDCLCVSAATYEREGLQRGSQTGRSRAVVSSKRPHLMK